MYRKYGKRVLDFTLVSLTMAAFWWLFLIIGFLVRVKLGSPVIFKQERPGKDEKIFTLYKFRTMTEAYDQHGNLLPDSVRLTAFGRFLRSTSLDELPELWNILRGEMSIVGPRPLALQYLPYYNEEERKRHQVLPGLTGLAQVNGRNATTWEKRFASDLEYVNRVSVGLDFSIIFQTVVHVICRSGIGERGIDSPVDFDLYRKRQQENT